jgi:hypothetical protein
MPHDPDRFPQPPGSSNIAQATIAALTTELREAMKRDFGNEYDEARFKSAKDLRRRRANSYRKDAPAVGATHACGWNRKLSGR